jgi:hypothetical protein
VAPIQKLKPMQSESHCDKWTKSTIHSRRAEVSRAASFCWQGVTGTMPDLVLVVVEVDAP